MELKSCQKWAIKCLYSEELTLAGELRMLLRAAAAESTRSRSTGDDEAPPPPSRTRLHTVSAAITSIQSTLLAMTHGDCDACRNCETPIEIGNPPGDLDYLNCPAVRPTLPH
jgi:hypothetical protein